MQFMCARIRFRNVAPERQAHMLQSGADAVAAVDIKAVVELVWATPLAASPDLALVMMSLN